ICNVEFKAAVPSKDIICTNCTQLLFATYDIQKPTYEPLTEVIVDLASTRATVLSLCGSDFLSKVTVTTSVTVTTAATSSTSALVSGASSSLTTATGIVTSASSTTAATTSTPTKSAGVKFGASVFAWSLILIA
ncbi:hypothetical protein HK096_007895, partial [Nowakowskiella sp. JEL0078]